MELSTVMIRANKLTAPNVQNDKIVWAKGHENNHTNKLHLKSMKTVAGIRKISLQAMNFKMFCWLDPSLSRRFLTNIRLLGPIDYRKTKKLKRAITNIT